MQIVRNSMLYDRIICVHHLQFRHGLAFIGELIDVDLLKIDKFRTIFTLLQLLKLLHCLGKLSKMRDIVWFFLFLQMEIGLLLK